MKIKITTGYSSDEKFTIESDEAHKAYYLFNNPEKRGVFSNGVAILGKDIRSILPDWNATMGWNATHKLEDDDFNEIRDRGVDKTMNEILTIAQSVAKQVETETNLLLIPLSQIMINSPKLGKPSEFGTLLANKFKV